MKEKQAEATDYLSQVPVSALQTEFDKTSSKYHIVAALVAIVFDPVFAVTDYYNIPANWQTLFYIRLSVSLITIIAVLVQRNLGLPSKVIVLVPFLLISLQNAFTYSLIENKDLLGHNLNYIALLIGAAMFLNLHWKYSAVVLVLSALATAIFLASNNALMLGEFFIQGGLLLITVGIFMFVLINTRYNLTIKEINARLALQISKEEIQLQNKEIQIQNDEIQSQAEEIRGINENLEQLVKERTMQLEKKTKALEDYAFINAHKLRSPVASILGLTNLISKSDLNEQDKSIITHLQKSTEELDAIVTTIKRTIEKVDS